MKGYEILHEHTGGGFHLIEITEGRFEGVKFFYTRVSFREGEDGVPILQFTYNLVDGEVSPQDEATFRQKLGDMLLDIMGEQLARNSIVYTGGI